MGETTWSDAIGSELEGLGWTLSAVEIGTGGSLGQLLGDPSWVRFDEAISLDAPAAGAHGDDLLGLARRARELGGSEVGIAIRASPRTGDTAVSIAVSTPTSEHEVGRIVFLTGPLGRSRSALAAAAVILETLKATHLPADR
jgi:hypothetical protein